MKIKQDLYVVLDPEYSKTIEEFDGEEGSCFGKIVIDDFYEHFYMSPQVWTMEQYQQQWKLALERIHTHDTSYFMQNIQLSNRIAFMWTMNKLPDLKKIRIKNTIIIEERFEELIAPIKNLTPENSFLCTPDLKKYDQEFLERLNSFPPNSKKYKEFLDEKNGYDQWYVDYED